MRKKKEDLVNINFNDLSITMGVDKFVQLKQHHIDLLKRYDADNKIKGNGKVTRTNQLFLLMKFIIKLKKPFEEITRDDINSFLVMYDGNTLERYKQDMKKFFKWLKKPELIEHLKQSTVAEKLTKEDLWSEDDVLRLTKVLDPDPVVRARDKCCLLMMFDLAIERKGIHELNVGDIIDHEGTFLVKITGKKRGRVQTRILETITSTDSIRKWLNAHPDNLNKSAPLFVSFSPATFGQRLYDGYPWALLKKLQKRAKIAKPIRPHLLRHSKATQLYIQGYRGRSLQKFLGHSNLTMQERYTHLDDSDVNDERFRIEMGIDRRKIKPIRKSLMAISCPKCQSMNEPQNLYCSECNYPLNPDVLQKELRILKLIRSELFKDEMRIAKTTGEFVDVEEMADEYDDFIKELEVPLRKKIKPK